MNDNDKDKEVSVSCERTMEFGEKRRYNLWIKTSVVCIVCEDTVFKKKRRMGKKEKYSNQIDVPSFLQIE